MGPIYDRSQEHLGTSDVAIVACRQRLLKAVRDLQQGIEPYAVRHPDVYAVRPLDAVCPIDAFDAMLSEYAPKLLAPIASAATPVSS
jgi:hypothetical protein